MMTKNLRMWMMCWIGTRELSSDLSSPSGKKDPFEGKKPLKPSEVKTNKRPESITAQDDMLLKNQLGPKYEELKYSINTNPDRQSRKWRTA